MRSRNFMRIGLAALLLTVFMAGLCLVGLSQAGAATNPKGASLPKSGLPGIVLPGDSTPAAAYGNQEMPQIAAGASGYLVVWEDSRTNYRNNFENALPAGGESNGQYLKDIYAARLDLNGNLIDTTPIVVAQATWSQTVPQVAWNGQNWLVVWNSKRQANFSYTTDVMGARVSPAGQVLDNPAIVVDGNPTIDELWPTVASDGNNWVVLWMDQGAYFELDATRISPAGVVLDPGGIALHTPQFPDAPYNPALTFAGDEYLVVFSGDNKIKGLRFSPALQRIGSVFQVSVAGNFPEVASNGTDFFAAYQMGNAVYGARITHEGVVLDPAGLDISGSNGGYPYPDVSFDGTNWLVSWSPYANTTLYSRVTQGGQVLDVGGINVAGSTTNNTAVAGRPGGGGIVVWTSSALNGLTFHDIFAATVSSSGTPGTPYPVSMGAPRQTGIDLAANGTGYLAVFQSAVSGDTRIKGQRLNADGSAIDTEPFLIAGGSRSYGRPRVAWNGTLYLVVWEDSSLNRGFVPGAILGKRVAADGTVLDASPFEIMPGNGPDVAALGSTFLVIDSFENPNHYRPVYGVRVGGDGVVQGSPVVIGGSYSVNVKVSPLGDRWLAVWQQHPTHDNPYASIRGNFVAADGSPGTNFLVGQIGSTSKHPDVALGPNQALISFFGGSSANAYNGDLYARRIQPDGTFLDGPSGLQLTSAPNGQFLSSAAWTGSEYIVAFEDNRATAYLEHPVGDIYGVRVGSDGTIMDPANFPISNELAAEVNPVAAANPQAGSYLIGFANFKQNAPFGHYRTDIRRGTAGSPPVPEATSTPTSTPSPTPPVCVPGNYAFTEATGAAIVPGTVDIGNHCDECATEITLPFPFTLYDQTFTTVEATANGTLNFVYSGNTGGINFCLPYSGLGYSILPHWEDMMTVGAGGGIFTSVSGSAPNRVFNIEWRACSFGGGNCGSDTYNFEARLYEGQSKFELIYGQVSGNGSGATVGVQKDTGQRYTQYECNTGGLAAGLKLTFEMASCATSTPAPPQPTNTPGLPPTNTPAQPSATRTTAPTNTSVPQSTNTPGLPPTNTPVMPSATPTICQVSFVDVQPGHTFYQYVMCLACRQILGGYPDGTFRPSNNITRGQLSKIVSNAAGWNEPVNGQTFLDVPPTHTFYPFIERMAARGVIGGYPDGTFRPENNATRGQISKIVAKARGYEDPKSAQMFEDVPTSHTFYLWIQNLGERTIMGGYVCGGPGEPCGAENKPYFRPAMDATRGQVSKIVSNSFFPNCNP